MTIVIANAPAKVVEVIEPGPRGRPGPAGQSFELAGSAATYADLPADLSVDDAGQAWLVNADGRVYVWSGTAWPADGTGALLSQGGGDASFHFHQATAADSWSITHNLGKRPSVTVTDSAGNRGLCAVRYVDENNLVVSFGGAFAGDAYLN